MAEMSPSERLARRSENLAAMAFILKIGFGR
jgi:hypothetical protein